MYRIDTGEIRPSKQLANSLASMIKGKREFVMLDDQKIVFEAALALTRMASKGNKQVLIVEGGPGTGKSVVAVNLIVELTKRNMLTQYVTKNAAPRAVYQSKLTGTLNKTSFGALFQSSGVYINMPKNAIDALVVDEAHRLNAKSGRYQNKGENQIKEIINAAKCSIFFLDEDQKISLKDIGTKEEIQKQASKLHGNVELAKLSSQFRCNGSDAYMAFLDNLLQIRPTANMDIKGLNYEFGVCDNPVELRDLIFKRNKKKNSARLVAGYCWDWISDKNPSLKDICFPEYSFAMKWNLKEDGGLYMIKANSVNEVGCIHTCQGLEIEHIGVIIGPDLIVRNGKVLVDPAKRSKMDMSIRGYKKLLRQDPERAEEIIRTIILNTYRTLMTRGMKSCNVWAVDKETNEWLKMLIRA